MRPQAQASPSGSTTTWPISPAAKRSPTTRWPSSTRPAPTPWPTLTMSRLRSAAPPRPSSPSTAALASLATWTGQREVVVERGRRGRASAQPRLGASITTPRGSTTPGLPTPTPSSGRSAAAARSAHSVRTSLDRGVAGAAVALGDPAVEDLAGQVDQGGAEPLVVAEVDGDGEAGVGDDAEQGGGLADPAGALAVAQLLDEALGEQLGGQVAGGDPGEVGGPGQVGPADGALAEHRAQDEGPVVPAGVARHGLAPGLAAAGERPVGAAGRRSWSSGPFVTICLSRLQTNGVSTVTSERHTAEHRPSRRCGSAGDGAFGGGRAGRACCRRGRGRSPPTARRRPGRRGHDRRRRRPPAPPAVRRPRVRPGRPPPGAAPGHGRGRLRARQDPRAGGRRSWPSCSAPPARRPCC